MNFSNSYLHFNHYKIEKPNVIQSGNKILLVVSPTDWNENKDFLAKIMGACKIDLTTCSVFGLLTNEFLRLSDAIKQDEIQQIIVFGITPDSLGLNINPQIKKFSLHNRTYIFTENLKSIQENKEVKVTLWNQLKEVFL